eukprot:7163953-Alexandrium_andersonii.AAC.1
MDPDPDADAAPANAGGDIPLSMMPSLTMEETNRITKNMVNAKSGQISISGAVRSKLRESVRHFRKWTDHRFDFSDPNAEKITPYDLRKIQRMRSEGASPWNGRALLREGYHPQTPEDFGFNLGDEPPYSTGAPTRDVRYDK